MTKEKDEKGYQAPKIVKRTKKGKLKFIPPISKNTFESLVADLSLKTDEIQKEEPQNSPLLEEIEKFRTFKNQHKADQEITLDTIFASLSGKPSIIEKPSSSSEKKITEGSKNQNSIEYEQKLETILNFQCQFASEIKNISIERQIYPPFHKMINEIKFLLRNSYSENQDAEKQTEEIPKQIQEISSKIKFISNQLNTTNIDQNKISSIKKLLQDIIDFIQGNKDQKDLDKIKEIETAESPKNLITKKDNSEIPQIMDIVPSYKSPEEKNTNNIRESIDMIATSKPTEAEIGLQELEKIKKLFEETKLQLIEAVNDQNLQETVVETIKLLIIYWKEIIQEKINIYIEVPEKISQKITIMTNLTTEIGRLKKANTEEAQIERERLIGLQAEHKEILEMLERQKRYLNLFKRLKKQLIILQKKLES